MHDKEMDIARSLQLKFTQKTNKQPVDCGIRVQLTHIKSVNAIPKLDTLLQNTYMKLPAIYLTRASNSTTVVV
jgi:hypothetical protein